MRIAAIGDIHGCRKQFKKLLKAIMLAEPKLDQIVLLGDYVDRGPDSKGVIDMMINWDHDIELVCLRGNHEDMMIRSVLHNSAIWATWVRNGGKQTIESIGGENLDHYARWLDENCKTSHNQDGLFFAHAGANPNYSLDEQDDEDLMWIRNEFLSSNHNFGQIVVHGHTPKDKPEIRHNRINLDTGCCYGGKLSAGIFHDGEFKRIISE